MPLRTFFSRIRAHLLPGDVVVILAGILFVAVLFNRLWQFEPANKLRIRQGSSVYATLSLNQVRTLEVPGPLGVSRIFINHGRVRFVESPCHNQYCVHQGWLKTAGQVAVCLPNQVSVELLGSKKLYDSLNY
ncbi:MAG TPA: NusG domain II-containing protein [Methylophilaceae bacterium]|nr:NusG domain II-containing protein [Methylophilaceae bacterium]